MARSASHARRPVDRPPPAQPPVRADGRARGDDQGGDPHPPAFGDGTLRNASSRRCASSVNDELGALETALPAAIEMPAREAAWRSSASTRSETASSRTRLPPAGEGGSVCRPTFRCAPVGTSPRRGCPDAEAVRPSAREAALNPRSASARLRVGEKVRGRAAASGAASAGRGDRPTTLCGRQAAPRARRPIAGPRRVASGVVWIVRSGVLCGRCRLHERGRPAPEPQTSTTFGRDRRSCRRRRRRCRVRAFERAGRGPHRGPRADGLRLRQAKARPKRTSVQPA